MAISFSVSHFTRSRCRMRPSFAPQNWVRSRPPPSTLLFFDVPPLSVESLHRQCVVDVDFSLLYTVGGAGELVWRRHRGPNPPSRHAVRATCMEILPLIEMYCRWELEEECGNLRDLMERFDSQASLETTELGRNLLLMLRDDDVGLQFRTQRQESLAIPNPFAAIRGRLAAVDRAFQGLHAQVLPPVDIGLGVSSVRSLHLSHACAYCLRSFGCHIICNTNFVSNTAYSHFAVSSICATPPWCLQSHVCVSALSSAYGSLPVHRTPQFIPP